MYISSLSRRQLARRRWARTVVRYEVLTISVGLLLAFGAFFAGRGGI